MITVPAFQNPRPLFAEVKYTFTVNYRNGKKLNVPAASREALDYWRNAAKTSTSILGISNIRVVTQNQPVQGPKRPVRTVIVGALKYTYYSDGTYTTTRIAAPITTPKPPATTPRPPATTPTVPAVTPYDYNTPIVPNQQSVDTTALQNKLKAAQQQIQQLWANLEAKKKQIEDNNRRLSQQVTDLGQSTVDRSNEIQQNTQYITDIQNQLNEVNKRVSQQLIDLGNAVGDVSEALKAAQLAQQAQQVVQQGQGALGQISEFFSKPTNILLVGGALVLILLLVKR